MKILFVASCSPIVADPSAAQRFYVDGMGLAFEGKQDDYVHTEQLAGMKHFGLWPLAHAAQACFGTDAWPAELRVPQAALEFEVDDVAGAERELIARGHTLLHATRVEPWGQTIARLLSPDGLLVGVCHTPWLHATAS